jgi:hypothetical protein
VVGGPLPRGWNNVISKAKELNGIEIVSVGCLVTPYDRGYRDVAIKYLSAKYGRDPIPALEGDFVK